MSLAFEPSTDGDTPLPYPRRCDSLARKADTTLLYALTGAFTAILLWASLTSVDQVTRGGGRVVPQVQNQLIQHLEGGIISAILVREGQMVQAGDVLMRVENSFSTAELSQTRLEITSIRARAQRLRAEVAGLDSVTFEQGLQAVIPAIVAQERELFETRRQERAAEMQILQAQLEQKELELSELETRWQNTQRERELVRERVESLRRLAQRGAVSNNALLQDERILQQIETRLSDLLFAVPRAEAALEEIRQRIAEADARIRQEAQEDLVKAEFELAQLEEAANAMQDRSARSEVTAPIDGIVNKLFLTTVGGVVRTGEPLVELVPADAAVVVEARLSPADRAEIWPGLPAVIKITAYEFSVYGGLDGRITDISPDVLTDENGEPYFRVRLEAEAGGFGPDLPVVPGMTADVDIITGEKTVLSTILTPVQRISDNALRQ
ncbi:MAG: HlyD family type I secretion periplasmic adaptor subunit [Pseudomonadota bacterium]